MKPKNKFKDQMKRCYQRTKNLEESFFSKGFNVLTMLLLMTLILQQCLNNNVEAKTLQRNTKKTLKLLQSSSSSLLQLRHKRDVFTNDQHQLTGSESFVKDNMKYYENLDVKDDGKDNNDYYDENYDVIPNIFDSSQPTSMADQISEKVKQVAESFSNMWKSLGESVRHCMEAFRGLFGDDNEGQMEILTPEQELKQQQQQLFDAMKQQYRLKHEYDNEVLMNVYEDNM